MSTSDALIALCVVLNRLDQVGLKVTTENDDPSGAVMIRVAGAMSQDAGGGKSILVER